MLSFARPFTKIDLENVQKLYSVPFHLTPFLALCYLEKTAGELKVRHGEKNISDVVRKRNNFNFDYCKNMVPSKVGVDGNVLSGKDVDNLIFRMKMSFQVMFIRYFCDLYGMSQNDDNQALVMGMIANSRAPDYFNFKLISNLEHILSYDTGCDKTCGNCLKKGGCPMPYGLVSEILGLDSAISDVSLYDAS